MMCGEYRTYSPHVNSDANVSLCRFYIICKTYRVIATVSRLTRMFGNKIAKDVTAHTVTE